jgi:hypothetical protein
VWDDAKSAILTERGEKIGSGRPEISQIDPEDRCDASCGNDVNLVGEGGLSDFGSGKCTRLRGV